MPDPDPNLIFRSAVVLVRQHQELEPPAELPQALLATLGPHLGEDRRATAELGKLPAERLMEVDQQEDRGVREPDPGERFLGHLQELRRSRLLLVLLLLLGAGRAFGRFAAPHVP